jgi:ketosteroid isomerase-like protein
MKTNFNPFRTGWMLALSCFFLVSATAQDKYLPATTKSKSIKALYVQSMDALTHADFNKGIELALKALDEDPQFFMGHYIATFSPDKEVRQAHVESLVNHQGKLNKAETILQRLATDYKANPKLSPISYWEEINAKYKKTLQPKIMLAYLLINEKDRMEEAFRLLNECIALKADFAPIYNTKGYAHLQLKEYDDAKQAFDKYLELAPDRANPYDSKGDYFMAVKKYKEAHDSFKMAYEKNNNFEISLKKAKEAKWMLKREKTTKQVEMEMQKLIDAYNAKDMKKYLDFYLNGPEFSFSLNGKKTTSYKEFAQNAIKSSEKYTKWHVSIPHQEVDLPDDNVVVLNQIFQLKSTNIEGEEEDITGSFVTIWKKQKDQWKIATAIEFFPLNLPKGHEPVM